MATEAYLGEINLVSFNFAPKGWALCNGQLLPINQNQALFSLLGTTYGGDGRTTFALPNLQGRTGVGFSSSMSMGGAGGSASETLAAAELPSHQHAVNASTDFASSSDPTGHILGAKTRGGTNAFAAATNMTPLKDGSIGSTGGNQAHNNMQPYLVLNYIIALQGIFPSQN
jgi:microcystin-dependent protein